MFPWSQPKLPREDLRLLQAEFDAEGQAARLALLDDVRASEPPFWIGLALLVFLALALPIGVAVLP